MISKEDIILALSYSGETDEILKIVPFIHSNGNRLISMTGNPESALAKNSDVHLDVGVRGSRNVRGSSPPWSTNIYDLTHPLRLCYSSRIHTPLSIGMCQRSLITCLPERSFDKEEAELIFSHELHHIQRHDTHTKFFLGLCRALGWFHPLVWMAIRKAEDDLELSCDEIVLRNADERKRKKYASLLLTIAGDARGYTTCLSSSAKTLRYRLKAVMPGKEKHLGLCLLLFTMIISFLCIGNIALTTKRGTVTEVTGIENTAVRNAAFLPADQNKTDQEIPIDDTEALSDYLKQLTIEKPLTAYNEKTLSLNKPALRGSFSDTGSFFMLYDHSLSIHDSDKSRTEWYHVRTPVDWEYILSL